MYERRFKNRVRVTPLRSQEYFSYSPPLKNLESDNNFYKEVNEHIRTILRALETTAQGISSLRTCSGDAHGRERGFPKIDLRIARLAVNAANTLSKLNLIQ